VLYPAPLRDFLIQLATTGLFRGRWTADIHAEWIRNVLRDRPDLSEEQLQRTRRLMDNSVLDCLVTGYADLIPSLSLPDPDDRHVLAAAIRCGADAIVTFNRRDFPTDMVGRYDIEVQHPDDFIHHQLGLNEAEVVTAAAACRGRLINPRRTAAEYLDTLEQQSLPKTVSELRRYAEVI
jgi:hypothetical protein